MEPHKMGPPPTLVVNIGTNILPLIILAVKIGK